MGVDLHRNVNVVRLTNFPTHCGNTVYFMAKPQSCQHGTSSLGREEAPLLNETLQNMRTRTS